MCADNNDGSCAGAVVNRYFHDHFPKAIETAEAFRKAGNPNRTYAWMTQSWLIDVYRHCAQSVINIHADGAKSDLVCPNATQLAAVEAAAKRGDINW